MRWRWVLLLWACAALSGGSAARAASDPVLPVTITAFVGMPADSTSRREFLDGFDSAFEAGERPCESHVGDPWKPTGRGHAPSCPVGATTHEQRWRLSLGDRPPPPRGCPAARGGGVRPP